MSEQQKANQSYEKLAEEVQETIPAEPERIEYEPPKLTHHGKVRDLTNTAPFPSGFDAAFGPPFTDIS